MNREQRRAEAASQAMAALKAEVESLRSIIHRSHNLHHDGKPDEAHEILHGDSALEAEAAVAPENGVPTDATINRFSVEFNSLCAKHRIAAAWFASLPVNGDPANMSLRAGGYVPLTRAIGNALTRLELLQP